MAKKKNKKKGSFLRYSRGLVSRFKQSISDKFRALFNRNVTTPHPKIIKINTPDYPEFRTTDSKYRNEKRFKETVKLLKPKLEKRKSETINLY